MARPDCAALLQLPRDGGAGNDIHCGDGAGGDSTLARGSLSVEVDVVVTDDGNSVAVHREYSGMDDGGTGTAAMADLRNDANDAWGVAASGCRKRVVHVDRIYGDVYGAGDSVFVLSVARDRDRAGTWQERSGSK